MGYCIDMIDRDFIIKRENKEKALSLLKQFCELNTNISWVNNQDVVNAKTLKYAMEECRYDLEEDGEGNVVDIMFRGAKLGDDELIFTAIASCIENNSFIQMRGEDGGMWRWVFKDGICKEINAKIVWEED